MYKQNRIIKEVKKYCINKMNDFVYWSNNKIFFNEKKIIEDKISNINLYNKTLIYNVNFQYVFYYNLITKKNYKLKEVDGFSQFVNDNLILIVKNSDDYLKQYISLFDLQNKQKKWTIETYFGNGIIQDNHLYATCIKKRICKIDLNHPEQPLWQFELSQLAPPKIYSYIRGLSDKEDFKVEKIIGILENKVWVALNNYTLIALDVKTGKLMFQLSEIPGFDYNYGNIIPAPKSMKIDKERNLLYGLAWEYYWEIDPKTGEIQMWNLYDYFVKLKLRNDLILYYVKINNILYFASRPGGLYESQIAGFDIITKKIVWQHKFNRENYGHTILINDVKGNDKMLAILDMGRNLYIFEKQNNKAV